MIPEGGSAGERAKALATEQELGWRKGTRDRLGFQGKKKLPPFSDPSKSEGRRFLYNLSIYERSERNEGFLR
jgi:hypothetical protein